MKMKSPAEAASKQTADSGQVLCLPGKMTKAVFTFIRLFVLLLGFSIICLGVLCVSSSSSCKCGKNELMFYCLLALGLFLLVAGIFWSTFHEVSKCRGLSSIFIQNPSHRELRISTVDRPDFYPPSYEDSTDPEKQSSVLQVDSTVKQEEIINIPPPPYSESSAELISETDEQEQPPPYELSVQQLQQQQTADQCSNLRRRESNFNPSTRENTNRIQTARESQKEQHLSEHPRQAVGKNPATVKQTCVSDP